jgi:hypothetical protein
LSISQGGFEDGPYLPPFGFGSARRPCVATGLIQRGSAAAEPFVRFCDAAVLNGLTRGKAAEVGGILWFQARLFVNQIAWIGRIARSVCRRMRRFVQMCRIHVNTFLGSSNKIRSQRWRLGSAAIGANAAPAVQTRGTDLSAS